ncbi:hypothetical protein [Cupriavidus sp. Agwp_2]|uniref:hypothetical protein n=1 Tax=Cupriavidus sp. Agwp_2 TaxID=2897324 RepID=UPI003460DA82
MNYEDLVDDLNASLQVMSDSGRTAISPTGIRTFLAEERGLITSVTAQEAQLREQNRKNLILTAEATDPADSYRAAIEAAQTAITNVLESIVTPRCDNTFENVSNRGAAQTVARKRQNAARALDICNMYGRPRFVKRCIQQWIGGRDCSHVSGLDVRLMPAVPDGIRWSAPYQRCEPCARVAYQASANHGLTVLPSLFDRLSNRWSGDFSCVRLYR